MNSSKFRGILFAVCAVLSVALSACGGKDGPEQQDEDCRTCDDMLDSSKVGKPMCAVDADCEPEPIAIRVEVKNDWSEADRFTVEHKYGTTSGALMVAVPVDSGTTVASVTTLSRPAGSAISFRMVRTINQDSTFWNAYTVPSPSSGATTFQYHLATSTSTPACPVGRSMCVYATWLPGGTPILL
jgi:hypothetical protein